MADITHADLNNMSDEELLSFDPSTLAFNSETPTDEEEEVVVKEPAEEIVVDEPEEVLEDEDNETTTDTDEDDTQVIQSGNVTPDTPVVPAVPGKAKVDTKAPVTEVVAADDAAIKDFYSKITAPFKANGRDMKVENADEAIRLMQMGANYNKKMGALRPNLQLMKMLENAGLLSEEKLNFLIDVAAKKPEAINKLVKDSGIDPLDISTEKADDYQPTNHRVSEKTLALDDVLDELKPSEHYGRTLSVIAETLDLESRNIVADNPAVIRKLHQHIADGVFDQVWAEVERQKTFDNLSGLSDLEAYRQIGDAMASSGKLKLPAGVAPPQNQSSAPAKVVVTPNPKKADDSDRRNKRQAASPTKAAAPSSNKLPADFNPLSMSDEDIMKLDISKFR